jgi:hypothetical protein
MESERSQGAKVGVDEQKPDMRPNSRRTQHRMGNPKVTRSEDGASGNDQRKERQLTWGDLEGCAIDLILTHK